MCQIFPIMAFTLFSDISSGQRHHCSHHHMPPSHQTFFGLPVHYAPDRPAAVDLYELSNSFPVQNS